MLEEMTTMGISSTVDAHSAARAGDRSQRGTRISAIDVVRGVVIVLMVLDHTRDFLMSSALSPTDLSRTTPVLFFTRWVTHFCAPAFVFLAGVSASLLGRRLAPAALRRFLLSRGSWLIVLEFTVVSFAWSFNFRCLHVQSPAPFGFVHYPLIPWIGIMALGYAAGPLFELPAQRRKRIFVVLGFAAIAVFVVVRGLNGYGDLRPWSAQARSAFTFLSFLNVTKYPPSLAYALVTLGPILIALALAERARGAAARVLRTFGQVPLFAYVVHLFMVHLLAGAIGLAQGRGTTILREFFVKYPRDWGFSLGVVYLAWFGVLALLYPACHWFGAIKRTRSSRWLAYL